MCVAEDLLGRRLLTPMYPLPSAICTALANYSVDVCDLILPNLQHSLRVRHSTNSTVQWSSLTCKHGLLASSRRAQTCQYVARSPVSRFSPSTSHQTCSTSAHMASLTCVAAKNACLGSNIGAKPSLTRLSILQNCEYLRRCHGRHSNDSALHLPESICLGHLDQSRG